MMLLASLKNPSHHASESDCRVRQNSAVSFVIRDARSEDIPTITRIYNELGVGTENSYDLEPVSEENRLEWLNSNQAGGYPVLVAEYDGAVVGYAAYFQFKQKLGYRFTVENTIYIDESAQGLGIGWALMTELLKRARQAGIHTMIALINSTNDGSLAFHERLGFKRFGVLPQAGFKFGRYLDVAILAYIFE
jgi:phosphinothricin acetyltransferase